MLLVNPKQVTFGDETWANVTAVAVDRVSHREVVAWRDAGPYATFADVPEQRVQVRVMSGLTAESPDSPRPGQTGTLSFRAGPTALGGQRRLISMTAVVTGVKHLLRERSAVRTVELVALSSDGASDPVTVSEEGGEA